MHCPFNPNYVKQMIEKLIIETSTPIKNKPKNWLDVPVEDLPKKVRLTRDWEGDKKDTILEKGELGWYWEVWYLDPLVIQLGLACGLFEEVGEEGYFMGIFKWCNVCGKQYCKCPERQPDGSWVNKKYYYVSSKGRIEQKEWQDSHNDRARKQFRNCFETREEAEKYRNKIKNIL